MQDIRSNRISPGGTTHDPSPSLLPQTTGWCPYTLARPPATTPDPSHESMAATDLDSIPSLCVSLLTSACWVPPSGGATTSTLPLDRGLRVGAILDFVARLGVGGSVLWMVYRFDTAIQCVYIYLLNSATFVRVVGKIFIPRAQIAVITDGRAMDRSDGA